MSIKKVFALLFVFALALSGFGFVASWAPSQAVALENSYYSSLNAEEKVFYSGLESLLEGATTGNESVDIADNSKDEYIPQARLRECAEGDSSLFISMKSAIDAFRMDEPKYFYVNFDNIDLMLFTQTSPEQRYVTKLGYGSYGNFFYDFKDSVTDIKAKTDRIVDNLASFTHPLSTRNEKLTCLSDEIIKLAKPVKEENLTILDLPQGKANDLTYAQVFKLVCDKLGVPCYTVNGTSSARNTLGENQYFNLVELNSVWLINDLYSYASDEQFYLLSGVDTTYFTYQINEAITSASKKFKLPNLNLTSYNDESMSTGFVVTPFAKTIGERTVNDFNISFKGKGKNKDYSYAYMTYKDEWGVWQTLEESQIADKGDYITFNSNLVDADKIKFCVYRGEQVFNNILFESKEFDINFDNTKPPKPSFKVENSNQFQGAYRFTVSFTEPLLQNGDEALDLLLSSSIPGAADNATMLSLKLDNNILAYEVRFNNDNSNEVCDYIFTLQGVKGSYSFLPPQSWTISVGASEISTSRQVANENLFRCNMPTLIKGSASFTNVLNPLEVNLRYKTREEDGSVLREKFPDIAFFDCVAYDISFEKSGESIALDSSALLAIPYFKSYNMLSDVKFQCYLVSGGEVTKLKAISNLYGITVEIPKSGELIITTQKKDESKTIFVSQVGGGSVSESGIFEMSENKNTNIAADENNVIFSVAIDNQITMVNEETKTVTLNYDEVKDNSLIKIRFVPRDALPGDNLTPQPTNPRASKPIIVSQEKNRRVIKGKEFNLSVLAETPVQGELKYQWYLNDKLLKNETKSSLNAIFSKESAGNYFVVITNSFDGQSLSVQSTLINVNERSLSSYLTILYLVFGIFAVVYLIRFLIKVYKKPKAQEAHDYIVEEDENNGYVVEETLPNDIVIDEEIEHHNSAKNNKHEEDEANGDENGQDEIIIEDDTDEK